MGTVTITDGLKKPLSINAEWESFGEDKWEFCVIINHPDALESSDGIKNNSCLHSQVKSSLEYMGINDYTEETIKQSVAFILNEYNNSPTSDPDESYYGI
jgi:hypothetical protein